MSNRRKFLQRAGLVSLSSVLAAGVHGWAFRTKAQQSPFPAAERLAQASQGRNGSASPRLVVLFLRGAVDGLNVVVPYREPIYYQARPTIAIPQPGQAGGALRLDDRFGLHPALANLMPFWQQGNLAFVHACGSPDPTRSHFEAQDYMETGTPGIKTTSDGWMNRLLAQMQVSSPIQALNVGTETARILSGKIPVATIAVQQSGVQRIALDSPQMSDAFDRLYDGSDALSRAYRQGREVRQVLLDDEMPDGQPLDRDMMREMQQANNGAPLPTGFAGSAARVAQMMAEDSQMQLVFLSLGGWDTHVNQGSTEGLLANRLQHLGEGLSALVQGLGEVYADTTILVMSEFGRTLKENGNRGTDHGHGNAMWLLGGNVLGGKVHGEWQGLTPDRLYQRRDLAITTDFRDVAATVLDRHLHLDSSQIRQIFPDFAPSNRLALL